VFVKRYIRAIAKCGAHQSKGGLGARGHNIKKRVSNFQYTPYKVTKLFDQINTSIGDRELLIGVNKIKALLCEQAYGDT